MLIAIPGSSLVAVFCFLVLLLGSAVALSLKLPNHELWHQTNAHSLSFHRLFGVFSVSL